MTVALPTVLFALFASIQASSDLTDSVEGVLRLDAEHAPLHKAFEESGARARLVAILSPT